jgi:hypothetical protein
VEKASRPEKIFKEVIIFISTFPKRCKIVPMSVEEICEKHDESRIILEPKK